MNESDARSLFRRLFLAELELGQDQPLESYLPLFPGFEDEISEQYRRLHLGEGEPTPARGSFDGSPAADSDRVGHYRIVKEIGRGGQGAVYLAEDDELQRSVALKVLRRAGPGSDGAQARFEREAKVTSRLQHPGICTVYDAGIENGLSWIAMQLLEGQTLAEEITTLSWEHSSDQISLEDEDEEFDAETDALTPPTREQVLQLARIAEDAARALHVAHEAGVIHRDIKPSNIMVLGDGRPVLLDFGLARDEEEELAVLTQTGDFFGTPAYMSPEQISAHRIGLDRRSDVFSLGVTLYEAVTLKRPFAAPSRAGIYQAIMAKEPPRARRENPAVPRDLEVILEKAMEKDRDRRYLTAEELAEDLRRLRCNEPITARRATLFHRGWKWCQRNRAVAASLLFCLVLCLGVAAREVVKEKQSDDRAVEERARLVSSFESNLELMAIDPLAAMTNPAMIADTIALSKEIGKKAEDHLIAMLEKGEAKERTCAALIFTNAPCSRAAPLLHKICLEDPSETVQAFASNALMRVDGPGIEDRLWEVYENCGGGMRVNALWGLCRVGDPRGLSAARDYLDDPTNSKNLKLALGQSLLFLRKPELVPLVPSILESAGKSSDLYRLAIQFLSIAKGGEALKQLEALAEDPELVEPVRDKAMEALEKLRGELPPPRH